MASCYIISVHVNSSFLESYGFFFLISFNTVEEYFN